MAGEKTLHLDEITQWIDGAFGGPLPDQAEEQQLQAALTDDGFQRFLRDQVNRQIIRDYLTNALVLGVITEAALPAFAPDLATEEGRAVLSLYMLMSSVEEARDLPVGHGEVVSQQPLQSPGDRDPADPAPAVGRPSCERSHIKLVPS